MTSKMISVRKEIYDELKRLKKPGESFSDLLDRMLREREKDPLKHFGIARDIPKEILDEFEELILNAKKENARRSSARFEELWGE